MKKSILAFLMLAALLTICMVSNESENISLGLPARTTEAAQNSAVSEEENTSPELKNMGTGLLVFERIFLPAADSAERISWNDFITLLKHENLNFSDDEGIATILEDSCDGSYLYAVLTNENGIVEIAQLGYHYNAAYGEYGVMVDWSEDTPRYLIDVIMPDSGTEVTSLTAVESYIVDAALRSSINDSFDL